MANEITMVAGLSASKGGAVINPGTMTAQQTMAGEDMMQETVPSTTSAALFTWGGITGVPAAVLIKNLDSTNYVEIGGDSGLTVFKLKLLAGKSILITPSSATMYHKANTASCQLLVVAVEA